MGIRFPLFLQDTDSFMYKLENEDELAQLEAIDIEEHEYLAWDVTGQPLELYLSGGKARVRESQSGASISDLKAAIVRYAQASAPSIMPALDSEHADVVDMFITVETQGKARGKPWKSQ